MHVIVRETEAEARAYAKKLMSKFDAVKGQEIKNRAQDSSSLGVKRQNQVREMADEEDYAEPLLWIGIGKARSGADGCLVGDPKQILDKLNRYMDMGILLLFYQAIPCSTKQNTLPIWRCLICRMYPCPKFKTGFRI